MDKPITKIKKWVSRSLFDFLSNIICLDRSWILINKEEYQIPFDENKRKDNLNLFNLEILKKLYLQI